MWPVEPSEEKVGHRRLASNYDSWQHLIMTVNKIQSWQLTTSDYDNWQHPTNCNYCQHLILTIASICLWQLTTSNYDKLQHPITTIDSIHLWQLTAYNDDMITGDQKKISFWSFEARKFRFFALCKGSHEDSKLSKTYFQWNPSKKQWICCLRAIQFFSLVCSTYLYIRKKLFFA